MTMLLLTLVALASSALSGLAGLGGGLVLLAAMASVLPPAQVVPLHGVVQLVSNGTRGLRLLRHLRWGFALPYAPGLVLGVWLGSRVYAGSDLSWLRPVVGGFVLVFLVWERLRPKRLLLRRWVFLPAGVVIGCATMLVGATGPLLATLFLRDDLEPREVVATQAGLQLMGHALKLPAFLALGFPYLEHLRLLAPLSLAAVAGTLAGTWLLGRVDGRVFRLVFRVVLALLALRLLLL
jgi:uncharacterized membrane protein YfcA